jgi:preprotein translocase subunit SecE
MADELLIEKNPWKRFRDYIAEIRVEMKRVTWPAKQEVYGTTMMVILTTFFFAVFFYICDQVFSSVVAKILKYFLGR